MKLIDKLSQNETDKIYAYNANSKLNSFLYANKDCDELFKEKTSNDRWSLVDRLNQIQRELIPFAVSLDGVAVEVYCDRNKSTIKGVIRHASKRIFEGSTYDNAVSFRKSKVTGDETIALWVDTDQSHTSHLYTIDSITIIEEPLERDPEDPSYE